MRSSWVLAALAALFVSLPAPPALACGPDSDCAVAAGEYRVRLPAGLDGEDPSTDTPPTGALLFFHGWQGSAEAEMRNRGLARLAEARGLVLIVPNGRGRTWSYPGAPRQLRDEFAFVDAVMRDAAERFGVARERTVVSGFSMGASMAWNVACRMGDGFAGFVPIAGAFWDPIPAACDADIPDFHHVHGVSDGTVPLAGRPIGDSARQSDVFDSLALLRREGACRLTAQDETDAGLTGPPLTCTRWACDAGRELELCLHPGGHSIRTEWLGRGLDRILERQAW